MKKIRLRYPLLVEGRYDKNRVSAVAEGCIICCGGFSVFNSDETKSLLRRITQSGKLLVLTDSDGAGLLIRNKLKGFLRCENVINLYAPAVKGVEKRKKAPSKAGLLGVEGMSDEVLRRLLAPYGEGGDGGGEGVGVACGEGVGGACGEGSGESVGWACDEVCGKGGGVGEARGDFAPVTTSLLYSLKLTGCENSSALRAAVCRKAALPESLSPKAFREALNLLGGVRFLNGLLKDIAEDVAEDIAEDVPENTGSCE